LKELANRGKYTPTPRRCGNTEQFLDDGIWIEHRAFLWPPEAGGKSTMDGNLEVRNPNTEARSRRRGTEARSPKPPPRKRETRTGDLKCARWGLQQSAPSLRRGLQHKGESGGNG